MKFERTSADNASLGSEDFENALKMTCCSGYPKHVESVPPGLIGKVDSSLGWRRIKFAN